MFSLQKVQEPVETELVTNILRIPTYEYSVKAKYSPTGKILNPKEYYASVKVKSVEEKKTSYHL